LLSISLWRIDDLGAAGELVVPALLVRVLRDGDHDVDRQTKRDQAADARNDVRGDERVALQRGDRVDLGGAARGEHLQAEDLLAERGALRGLHADEVAELDQGPHQAEPDGQAHRVVDQDVQDEVRDHQDDRVDDAGADARTEVPRLTAVGVEPGLLRVLTVGILAVLGLLLTVLRLLPVLGGLLLAVLRLLPVLGLLAVLGLLPVLVAPLRVRLPVRLPALRILVGVVPTACHSCLSSSIDQ
jgi:hypothetical protein